MKAPKDHWVIQIEVTNACVNNCSNCTRFCGSHKNPFFMKYDTFCKAVDSVIDHPGLIGIMGGEPTLHPRFGDMCRYLYDKLQEEKKVKPGSLKLPTDSFIEVRRKFELDEYEIHTYADGPRPVIQGAGLWTSMTKMYMKNFEVIQDVFNFQNLNDHINVSFHQPVLITRKDMGIDDKTWFRLRENCWVNRQWSSSITPKGCFFCEVAAALDMLYNGPGGLPIEKDWWKRDIEDFKEQFQWCELCGIPLKTFARDAREEITDVSVENYELMKKAGTVKMDSAKLNVLKIKNGKIEENCKKTALRYHGVSYIEDAQERLTNETPIFAEKFIGILVCQNISEIDLNRISRNKKYLEEYYILVNGILTEYATLESLGKKITGQNTVKVTELINSFAAGSYIILMTPEIELGGGIEMLKGCVVNPGTLHYIDFSKKVTEVKNQYILNASNLQSGICVLLNNSASSIKNMREDYNFTSNALQRINDEWITEKVVEFSDAMNGAMLGVGDEGNRSLTYRRRLHNGIKFGEKCIEKYGLLKTMYFFAFFLNHYGIKMTINKLKNRIF